MRILSTCLFAKPCARPRRCYVNSTGTLPFDWQLAMDVAHENSPGPPKWMAGTPEHGYPVDPKFSNQMNVSVMPCHVTYD